MRLGRRSRSKLVAILCISLLVVLVQIITVSRLSTPNKYPWEDDEKVKSGPVYTKRSAEDYRKGARNTLEVSCIVCDTTVFQMHDPAVFQMHDPALDYGSRKHSFSAITAILCTCTSARYNHYLFMLSLLHV